MLRGPFLVDTVYIRQNVKNTFRVASEIKPILLSDRQSTHSANFMTIHSYLSTDSVRTQTERQRKQIIPPKVTAVINLLATQLKHLPPAGQLNPNFITLASSELASNIFGASSELVRSWFEAEFGLSSSLLAAN